VSALKQSVNGATQLRKICRAFGAGLTEAETPGLRPGLCSSAASRLYSDALRAQFGGEFLEVGRRH